MEFRCILCNSDNYYILRDETRDNKNIKVVQCGICNHIQLLNDKDNDFYNKNKQLKRLYNEIDIELLRKKAYFDTNRRINYLGKNFNKDDKFLEIGIGYGFLFEALLQKGYDIDGIEVGKERREETEKRIKKHIMDYDLTKKENINLISQKYDCIMLFQVLEHIKKPILFLRNIRNILNDGGRIIIEIPNYNDHLLQVSELYSNFYYQEAHKSYFTYSILNKIMKEMGFHNIKADYVQRYSVENMMHWIINKKPQIDKPAYETLKQLDWLDHYYRTYLCEKGISDTVIITASK